MGLTSRPVCDPDLLLKLMAWPTPQKEMCFSDMAISTISTTGTLHLVSLELLNQKAGTSGEL